MLVAQSIRNSDISLQMNINQLEPKIADAGCSKSEILIPQSRWILTNLNLKLQPLVAQSIRNSDTSVQMNINQLEPKTADTSRAKCQKFWYLSPDEY